MNGPKIRKMRIGLMIALPWIILAGSAAVGSGGLVWIITKDQRRRLALAATAQRLGLRFQADAPSLDAPEYRNLHIFTQGRERTYRNILVGKPDENAGVIICDYNYKTGDGRETRTCRQTVALLTCPKEDLPRFELRPTAGFDRIDPVFGYHDIDFKDSASFSNRYLLRGPDEAAVRALFSQDLRRFFESHPDWCVDGRGPWLAIYRHDRLTPPKELPAFLEEAKLLLRAFAGPGPT
jgi:hypothetical protein